MELPAGRLSTELRSPLPISSRSSRNINVGGGEGVTDVANGVNQRRVAELLSQSTNEHFNQLGVVFVCVFPDTLAQLRAREHASRLAHQHLQQHHLARRKLDPLRGAMDIVRG